jgi:hypothetical protein
MGAVRLGGDVRDGLEKEIEGERKWLRRWIGSN